MNKFLIALFAVVLSFDSFAQMSEYETKMLALATAKHEAEVKATKATADYDAAYSACFARKAFFPLIALATCPEEARNPQPAVIYTPSPTGKPSGTNNGANFPG